MVVLPCRRMIAGPSPATLEETRQRHGAPQGRSTQRSLEDGRSGSDALPPRALPPVRGSRGLCRALPGGRVGFARTAGARRDAAPPQRAHDLRTGRPQPDWRRRADPVLAVARGPRRGVRRQVHTGRLPSVRERPRVEIHGYDDQPSARLRCGRRSAGACRPCRAHGSFPNCDRRTVPPRPPLGAGSERPAGHGDFGSERRALA